jgi:hypothetical protein
MVLVSREENGMMDIHTYAIPIEVTPKCRASSRSYSQTRQNTENLHRNNEFTDPPVDLGSHKVYMSLLDSCTEEGVKLFHKCVPDFHERFQLLHHSATHGITACFLLIGNDASLLSIYTIVHPLIF